MTTGVNRATAGQALDVDDGEDTGCLGPYTILDATQYLAGPFCTMILGALGATVIKIEPPDSGDPSRHQPPFATADGLKWERLDETDIGLAYLKRNVGKNSISLDLKSEADRVRLYQLVTEADVFIHNFRPGVAGRLGVDPDRIQRENPRIVYCAIDGLGAYAVDGDARGVLDIVGQALSGLMAITGEEAGMPVRCGAPIGDEAAGLFAAVGILAALLGRDGKSGEGIGRRLTVSMVGSLASLVWDEHIDVYKALGLPDRSGNGAYRNVPFNTYKATDGYVAIAAIGPREWQRLVAATGIPEFASHPEWSHMTYRVRDRAVIDGLLEAWVATRSRHEVVDHLVAGGVTAAIVNSVADILDDERYRSAYLYPVESNGRPTGAWAARLPISFSRRSAKLPL